MPACVSRAERAKRKQAFAQLKPFSTQTVEENINILEYA